MNSALQKIAAVSAMLGIVALGWVRAGHHHFHGVKRATELVAEASGHSCQHDHRHHGIPGPQSCRGPADERHSRDGGQPHEHEEDCPTCLALSLGSLATLATNLAPVAETPRAESISVAGVDLAGQSQGPVRVRGPPA